MPTMSVRDNIVLMALPPSSRWGFIAPGRVDRLVTDLIARLGIKTSGSRQNISHLSGGNQQKALIARMLCVEPRVLLLDEPTRGIDIGAKAEVQSIIQQLAEHGCGIVLISSELEDVVEGSARVVVLNRGAVVGELGRDEIDEHKIMELMGSPRRRGGRRVTVAAAAREVAVAISLRTHGVYAALGVVVAFNLLFTPNFDGEQRPYNSSRSRPS